MGGPDLQHHLVLRPQIDPLLVSAPGEVPEVEGMTVCVADQQFRDDPFSIMEGLPHSLEISTFWLRCHQAS